MGGVDVAQLYVLSDDLRKTKKQIRAELIGTITKATEQVRETAKTLAPVRTGALRESITSRVRGVVGTVEVGIEYGQYVEFGTYKDMPEPFVGPAGDRAQQTFPAEVEAAVIRALRLL